MNPLEEAKEWLEKQKKLIEQQKMFTYVAIGVIAWAMFSGRRR